jgi:hypothetical protein
MTCFIRRKKYQKELKHYQTELKTQSFRSWKSLRSRLSTSTTRHIPIILSKESFICIKAFSDPTPTTYRSLSFTFYQIQPIVTPQYTYEQVRCLLCLGSDLSSRHCCFINTYGLYPPARPVNIVGRVPKDKTLFLFLSREIR